MSDYFDRLKSSSNIRPTTPGVQGTSKARTDILKTNLKAFKPTGTMVTNSVNKTALHPGGVEPAREHTELEVCIFMICHRTK